MTALPKSVRELLIRSGFQVGLPRIAQAFVSTDGTERYLVACADGETVETVWMPNGDDGELGDGSDAATEEAGSITERHSSENAQFPIVARRFVFPARLGVR